MGSADVNRLLYFYHKLDLATLINTFRKPGASEVEYREAISQVLAERIALEPAIGQPVPEK